MVYFGTSGHRRGPAVVRPEVRFDHLERAVVGAAPAYGCPQFRLAAGRPDGGANPAPVLEECRHDMAPDVPGASGDQDQSLSCCHAPSGPNLKRLRSSGEVLVST